MFILKKKIFSRNRRSISIKPGINHPWEEGILDCSNEEPSPLQRGDNHKNVVGSLARKQEDVNSAFTLEGKIICVMKSGQKETLESPDDLFKIGFTDIDHQAFGLSEL